jgi:membrane protease YdiL (CAAX protease family)
MEMGMDTRAMLRALCAAAMLFVGLAQAVEPLTEQPSAAMAAQAIGKVEETTDRAYRDAIASFDGLEKLAPSDAEIAVARCRFIQHYTDEESGNWRPEALEAYDSCTKQLHERWPSAPQVQLFELEQLWGEEAAERGEVLLKSADKWPLLLRRDLLSKTSLAHEDKDDARAGELALMAVRLGDASRVAAAVKYLSGLKKFDEAANLLAQAEPTESPWLVQARIEAALTLPDPKIAVAEARRHPKANEGFCAEAAARAYLRVGDFTSAQRALKNVPCKTERMKAVRFDTAIASRDFADAVEYVDLTDTENFAANLGRFAELATRAPLTLINPPMLLALMICVAWVTVMALVPGMVLIPAHYRGLSRRLKGKVSEPLFPAIGLWRSWYASAVALVVPTVVAFLVEPYAMVGMLEGKVMPAPDMFRAFLWGETAALVFLLPALVGTNRRQLIGDRAALRTWWIVLLMWGSLLAIGAALTWLHGLLDMGGETTQTRMVAAMAEGGAEIGGPMLSLLLLALVGPVFEELAFRGLLLGGLSRHVSFGWANTLQALVFAAVHDDPPRLPYYLAMGLFAGWLVKRTGSLGPAIALHVLNNAVAIGAFLWMR